MTETKKTTALEFISKGHLREAIDTLLSYMQNSPSEKEARAIASRYNRLQQKERAGTLTFEQLKIAENQIVEHLIALIHQANYQENNKDNFVRRPAFRPLLRNILITAGFLTVALFILAEAFHFIDIFPPHHTLQLTVSVEDADGNPALVGKGRINIWIGNRRLEGEIGENGRINFPDIALEYKGDSIQPALDAPNWEIYGKRSFILTGESIIIKVKRDKSWGTIKGRVRSWDGQEFIEGAKVTVKDTFTYTDKNGYFKIILPEEMWIKSENESYTLTVSKPGYKIEDEEYSPFSSDAQIRLSKAENK